MNILLAGGGTLGPVMPLLAVAEVLARRGDTSTLVGTPNGPERTAAETQRLPFVSLPVVKLHRGWSVANARLPVDAARAYRAAGRILDAVKPDAVFGAGGFTSVPLGFAAKRRRIPVVVHQQDVVPSLSNRMLARIAAAITVSLPESRRHFPDSKVTLTGNPVRLDRLEGDAGRARARWGFHGGRPVTVVFGGGTGAAFINRAVVAALRELLSVTQILHVTGIGRGSAPAGAPGYTATPLLTDAMPDAYAVADAIVCRAGFSTLSELMLTAVPALVIPMPNSHQEANAAWFARAGAVRTVPQRELTPGALSGHIRSLLSADRKTLESARRPFRWTTAAVAVSDVLRRAVYG
jgi:UDP-N-acetylglucosamine--N-acetylmuramyl-(pentapeptide) pyrophosphoryl-undecaprenol N-acetylglucosamine transferase